MAHLRVKSEVCDECRIAKRNYDNNRNRKLGIAEFEPARCGTLGGHQRHIRNNERPCGSCKKAIRVRSSQYRDAQRGGPPRSAQPCGTPAAYLRHTRSNEQPCDLCTAAVRDRNRQIRGNKPWQPAKCGTTSGYRKHLRLGDPPCNLCANANREYSRKRRKPGRYWWTLWTNQGGWCPLCDIPLPLNRRQVHVDHKIPVARGGSNDLDNLQVVHKRCNLVKNCRDDDWAKAYLSFAVSN